MKLFNKLFFVIIFFNFLFFAALVLNIHSVSAVSLFGQETDVDSLDGFVTVVVTLSKWILGLSGSIALLAFIAGGAMMVASGGSSQMIERGKQTLIGAVVGLIIIFCSWITIKFVTEGLGGTFTAGSTSTATSNVDANKKIEQEKISKEAQEIQQEVGSFQEGPELSGETTQTCNSNCQECRSQQTLNCYDQNKLNNSFDEEINKCKDFAYVVQNETKCKEILNAAQDDLTTNNSNLNTCLSNIDSACQNN